MIDEKKFMEFMTALEDAGAAHVSFDNLRKFVDEFPKIGEWIPCAKQLPENEREVEITYMHNYSSSGEPSYLTARAFYEDGTLTVDESAYDWAENEYYEYIEETDSYMVPKGWYEDSSFAEEFSQINETVIAWRPIGEPYRPTTEERLYEWITRL